jgi:GT2 family glycosyltransferase
MYGEEVDYLWRARMNGNRIAVVRDAKLWHKVSASSSGDKSATRYYRVRNQNLFYRNYTKQTQKAIMLGFSILKLVRYGVEDLAHRETDLLRPTARGWYDGWFSPVPLLPDP